MSLRTDLRIATRNLTRNRQRTLVAVASVAMGIVAFLLASGFIEWIFDRMRESTIRTQLGHVQIVTPGYLVKGIADPYRFLLPVGSPELDVVRQAKGVRGFAQRLSFSGLISHGDTTISFGGEGIEPEPEAVISDQIIMSSGRQLTASDQKVALLGEGLAKNLGVVPGDDIVLLVSTANGAPNAIELKVVGVFYTASKDFDDNALRLPLDQARKLMRVAGATSWVVLLEKTGKTEAAVAYLRQALSAEKFEVIPWTDLADFYNKTVALYSKQIDLMKYIIGMLIILTISNTQTMNVLERTNEIGTVMAVGQRRSRVLQTFLIEGVLIGVLGGVVGVFSGYLLATILSIIGIPMPPAPGMSTGFTAEIMFTWGMAVDASVLALFTTLLASVFPAWKASRMDVVNALRCNQ